MSKNWADWIKGNDIKREAWVKAEYKSTSNSKLIPIGLVIMLVLFGFWWLATDSIEKSNNEADRLLDKVDKFKKDRQLKGK